MSEETPAATGAPPAASPIREALQRLTTESAVYGIGQAGGRAIQLLLVPILTRALSPEAFGISELVIAYSQTALLVLVFGVDGALARFFYDLKDREGRVRMASTAFAFRLGASAAIAIVVMLFASTLAAHLMGGAAYAKYLKIGAATLPFTMVVLFCNDVLRLTFQPWKFIALNLVQTVVVLSLSIVLVMRLHMGVVGVIYGRLAGDACAAGLGLLLARHTLRPRFDRGMLRRMLAYGLPVVPALFALGAIGSLDRYALQRTRSLEELAVYAVAIKFYTVVSIAATTFQLAYGPFAYARARTAEAPRLFARVLGLYVSVASLGALTVSVLAPEILGILVPAPYRGAALPALWLSFAAVAFGVYNVTGIGIALALKTPLLSVCAIGGALVAALGHALLTPRFGPTGAAMATFLAYGACGILSYRLAQHVHPIPYRGGRWLALFGFACLLALAVQRLGLSGPLGLVVKLAAVLLFAGVCVRLEVWKDRGAVAPH